MRYILHHSPAGPPAMFAPMSTLQSMLRYLEIIWLINWGPSERTRMPCTHFVNTVHEQRHGNPYMFMSARCKASGASSGGGYATAQQVCRRCCTWFVYSLRIYRSLASRSCSSRLAAHSKAGCVVYRHPPPNTHRHPHHHTPAHTATHLDEADSECVWLYFADELLADGADELVGGTEDQDVRVSNLGAHKYTHKYKHAAWQDMTEVRHQCEHRRSRYPRLQPGGSTHGRADTRRSDSPLSELVGDAKDQDVCISNLAATHRHTQQEQAHREVTTISSHPLAQNYSQM